MRSPGPPSTNDSRARQRSHVPESGSRTSSHSSSDGASIGERRTWKTWPGVPSLSPMTSWSMCSECWQSNVAPIGAAVIEDTSGGRS